VQPSKSSTATPALYGTSVTSPREHQVIELVAQGLKNCEVAEIIGTTEHVVKNYLRIIFDKLGVWNRLELALWYEARRYESPTCGQGNRGDGLMRRFPRAISSHSHTRENCPSRAHLSLFTILKPGH